LRPIAQSNCGAVNKDRINSKKFRGVPINSHYNATPRNEKLKKFHPEMAWHADYGTGLSLLCYPALFSRWPQAGDIEDRVVEHKRKEHTRRALFERYSRGVFTLERIRGKPRVCA
jgi:hypothetical protein